MLFKFFYIYISIFISVVNHLLKHGDKQDDSAANISRQKALLLLCRMQPTQTLDVRSKCIEQCKMPSLAVALTLGKFMKLDHIHWLK